MADLNLSTKAEIAVGEPRVPSAINTCFTEIEDHINNALIGDDNLTSPNNSVPRTVFQVGGTFVQGSTIAGTYQLLPGSGLGVGGVTAPIWIPNAADVAVAGKTAQVRLVAYLVPNATAPGINFTVGLHQVGSVAGGAGAITFTLLAAAATAVIATPAAGTQSRQPSSWINLSSLAAGGLYCLSVVLSGTTAANSISTITAAIEMRHN